MTNTNFTKYVKEAINYGRKHDTNSEGKIANHNLHVEKYGNKLLKRDGGSETSVVI